MLRFSEFSDNWKNTQLNEIANFYKGKNISKSDIVKDGKIECIRYGELYTNYGEVIEKIISKTSLPKTDLVFSKANDIIIPSSGETQLDIATASCVLKNDVALGGDLNIIRTQQNGIFISYYLNSAKKRKIASLAQGNSVVHLYNNQLASLYLNLPQEKEQQKIASFLSSIDKKIELLQQKKSLLKDYKKGVMQQIFSQELRFKPENGNEYPDWEEKKLGEILKIGNGKDYKHLEKGEIPVYGTGGIMTYVNDFLYEGESVGIGRKGTIDKPVFLDGKFWTVDTLFYTYSFKKVLPKFIYFTFLGINWKRYNEASGVPSLSKATIGKIDVSIPSSEEQTQIANFLSALDEKIALVNTQIENTQEFKKGLLQQMFV